MVERVFGILQGEACRGDHVAGNRGRGIGRVQIAGRQSARKCIQSFLCVVVKRGQIATRLRHTALLKPLHRGHETVKQRLNAGICRGEHRFKLGHAALQKRGPLQERVIFQRGVQFLHGRDIGLIQNAIETACAILQGLRSFQN